MNRFLVNFVSRASKPPLSVLQIQNLTYHPPRYTNQYSVQHPRVLFIPSEPSVPIINLLPPERQGKKVELKLFEVLNLPKEMQGKKVGLKMFEALNLPDNFSEFPNDSIFYTQYMDYIIRLGNNNQLLQAGIHPLICSYWHLNHRVNTLEQHQIDAFQLASQGRDFIGITKPEKLPLVIGIHVSSKCLWLMDSARIAPCPCALFLVPTTEAARRVKKDYDEMEHFVDITGVYEDHPMFLTVDETPDFYTYSEVIIGAPGLIISHMKGPSLTLSGVQCMVVVTNQKVDDFDEDVQFILDRLPVNCQRILLSSNRTTAISKLSVKYLKDPVTVDLTSATNTYQKLAEDNTTVPCMCIDKMLPNCINIES